MCAYDKYLNARNKFYYFLKSRAPHCRGTTTAVGSSHNYYYLLVCSATRPEILSEIIKRRVVILLVLLLLYPLYYTHYTYTAASIGIIITMIIIISCTAVVNEYLREKVKTSDGFKWLYLRYIPYDVCTSSSPNGIALGMHRFDFGQVQLDKSRLQNGQKSIRPSIPMASKRLIYVSAVNRPPGSFDCTKIHTYYYYESPA